MRLFSSALFLLLTATSVGVFLSVHDERVGGIARWIVLLVISLALVLCVAAIWSINREIRERIRAERELRERNELFASVLQNIGDGVVVTDMEGRFLVFNPAAERIVGRGPVEGGSSEWVREYGVFLPDGVTPFPTAEIPLVKAMQGEDTTDVEQFLRNAGNPAGVLVSVSGRPRRDADGLVRGGIVIVRDITLEKQARERVVKTLETSYQEIFDKANDAIYIHDAETGRVLDVNRRTCELFGVTRQELIDGDPRRFMTGNPGYTLEDAVKWLERAATEGPQAFEWQGLDRHGEMKWLEVSLKRAEIAGQSRILAQLRDIGDRKRVEEQLRAYTRRLEENNRELQDFVFVASHDLQEPLRKIQAFGDFLEEEAGAMLSRSASEHLDRIQGAAQRMSVLLEDLLRLTRIATRARPFVEVSLSDVVSEVVSDLEMRVRESGGQVETSALPRIDADPVQMQQLFQNLIGNALKYRKPGVPPIVRVEAQEDRSRGICRVQVRDNGIGFEQKYAEKIFNVFQRLHGQGEYEGTGIGLAICKKVVERHGGTVSASAAPGEGAVFEVALPLHQVQPGERT